MATDSVSVPKEHLLWALKMDGYNGSRLPARVRGWIEEALGDERPQPWPTWDIYPTVSLKAMALEFHKPPMPNTYVKC